MDNVKKIEGIRGMFFNTPLLEIEFLYKNKLRKIYAKNETFNFSGSIKDRVAYYVFRNSYLDGSLKENQKIVEVTSGNMGISFASIAKFLGHSVKIVMPDWLSRERYCIMELLGVEIEKISKEQGGFIGSFERIKDISKEKDIFYPDQFSNKYNKLAHKETTAVEIVNQLKLIGKKPEIFVAGVGTGGTVMGVYEYFEENNVNCKCYPLEPENSPTITTGGKKIGTHRIQGISDEFIPDLLKVDKLGKVVSVDDGDSIVLTRMLNKRGLSVGISSGANFLGVLKKIEENDKDDVVGVTTFSDSALKYLSTDLCREELIKDNFLSKDIKIIGYKTII